MSINPNRRLSKKKVAFFTFLSASFAKLSSLISVLIFTPLLYSGLGGDKFGTLQFALRMSSFGGLSNLGATSYLKIRLNGLLHDDPDDLRGEARKAIGDCLIQWLIFSPIALAWCWLGVHLVGLRADASYSEIWAIALLFLLVPISQLLSIPSVALFSSNQGYRAPFVNAALGVVGVGGGAIAVQLGFGLFAVAVGYLAAQCIGGLYSLYLARRYLPWFGATKRRKLVDRTQLVGSLGASASSLTFLGLQQVEIAAIGFTEPMAMAGVLAVSAILITATELVLRFYINALTPVMASYAHQRDGFSEHRVLGLLITLLYIMSSFVVVGWTALICSYWVPSSPVLQRSIICFVFVTSYARSFAQYDGFLLDQQRDFYQKIFLALILVAVPVIGTCWISGGILSVKYFWIIPVCMLTYSIALRKLACGAFTLGDFLSMALLLLLLAFEWYVFENFDLFLATGISSIAAAASVAALWFSPTGRLLWDLVRSRSSSKSIE